MKNKILQNTALVSLFLIVFIIYGCPGGGKPKVTLAVTDCAKDDITIVDSTKVTASGGSQWNLVADITVLCNGQRVDSADLKVEFWWPGGTIHRMTNNKGKLVYRKNGHGVKPSGETFDVTIEGNDGSKTVTFTVP